MSLPFRLLLLVLCLAGTLPAYGETKRIAILPTFSDFGWNREWQHALGGFDAHLQGELLSGWKAELLSRAGLSTVVFEQKLLAAEDGTGKPVLQVLPAELLVLTVFDFQRQELRVHVCRVEPKMKLEAPKVFSVKSSEEIVEKLPQAVAMHIAQVARLELRAEKPAGPEINNSKSLRCALLEPVSESGRHDEMSKVAPMIRAVLEQALASVPTGVELVERSQLAALMEEKTTAVTGAWNANAASSLGRIARADLILVPFVHFQKSSRIHTSLFAVEVSTGRMLSCRRWMGEALAEPPPGQVKALLDDALLAAALAKRESQADDISRRHAEAEFLIGLKNDWNGLRQSSATAAQQAARFGDAAMALGQDKPQYIGRAIATYAFSAAPALAFPLRDTYEAHRDLTIELRALRKSGQLEALHADARRIFELPLIELGKNGRDWERAALANLYLRTGDPQKALNVLTAGKGALRDLASNDDLYQAVAQALMQLGRYQECVDFVLSRERFSAFATLLVVDAYRALGNTHKEFKLLWHNKYITADSSGDRLVRLLELSIQENSSREALGYLMTYANAWQRNASLLRLPIVRARIAAGQKELAISDAQCFLLSARREKDVEGQKALSAILSELGAQPLEALPTARAFITLPASCSIQLIHDQTIDPKHASEVATHLSGFWGCIVKVRPVKLEVKKFASYNPLAQTVDGNAFAKMLLRVDLPDEATLGTVLLTQTKLISKEKDYVGDLYSTHAGGDTVLSDHYLRKFKGQDKRPLPLIDAIAASPLNGVNVVLWRESRKDDDESLTLSPVPPDTFASNGLLYVNDRELGISPRTGAFLQKFDGPALLNAVKDYRATALKEELATVCPDAALAAEISGQLAGSTPIIVSPPVQPAIPPPSTKP